MRPFGSKRESSSEKELEVDREGGRRSKKSIVLSGRRSKGEKGVKGFCVPNCAKPLYLLLQCEKSTSPQVHIYPKSVIRNIIRKRPPLT